MMFPLDQAAVDAIERCRTAYAMHIECMRKDMEPLSDELLLNFGRESRDGRTPSFHTAIWAEIRRRVTELPVKEIALNHSVPPYIETPIPRGASPDPQP